MPTDRDLLQRINTYLDAAPKTGARAEDIGPFTLFLNEEHGWRYYARPTPGRTDIAIDTVGAVRERQRALGQPETFEWIEELTPQVGSSAAADGMHVEHHPLMVLSPDRFTPPTPPHDIEICIVGADDDLAAVNAVAEVGFANRGTGIGEAGAGEANIAAKKQNPDTIAFQRNRMLAGLTVTATANVSGVIASVGSHQPLAGASELVGVATLPSFRRRGLGSAVTGVLVVDAMKRGVETIFLSADDDEVARVYERVGFRRVGTAGAASAGPAA